jgi:hypothetical protein
METKPNFLTKTQIITKKDKVGLVFEHDWIAQAIKWTQSKEISWPEVGVAALKFSGTTLPALQ